MIKSQKNKTQGLMDISHFRKEYTLTGLDRESLENCPFQQFEVWFKQAQVAKILEPNAMSLATVSKDSQPSVRTVLLKIFDTKGFVFFTNYNSDKAKDIGQSPNAALLFPWIGLERQVRISGSIEKISSEESYDYFKSRPHGSQYGAWASPQSQEIYSRDFLSQELESVKNKFKEDQIPLPDFWGGYRVVPKRFEFWQGRSNRLHDRFVYEKESQKSSVWKIYRIAP